MPTLEHLLPTPPGPAHQRPSRLLHLAQAALQKEEYARVVKLLEPLYQRSFGADANVARLYAQALAGRANEISDASPIEAEALLLKAVEASPDAVDAHVMLAKHYTRTKNYLQAMDAYNKVVELTPDASDAIFNLGYIHAAMGRFAAAEEAFVRVVQLEPPYLDKALFNLAVVQQKLGKRRECITHLEAVLAVDPNNEKAQTFLSRLRGAAKVNHGEQGQ